MDSTNSMFIMRVSAEQDKSKHWLVRSFSSQECSKQFADIASKSVPQVHTKACKTRFFFCGENLNYVLSSRHSYCDRGLCVTVFLLKERVHGSSIRMFEAGFQTKKILRV